MSGVAPSVSVVVPTFNRAAWIPGAIRSVAGQTLKALEIVVVDDGSTDATAATCFELGRSEPRLRVVTRPNGGLAAARNTGLGEASAPWVAFLDDDDLWHPEALRSLVDFAVARGVQAVACRALAFASTCSTLTADEILSEPREFAVEPWPPTGKVEQIELADLLLRTLVPIHAGLFATDRVIGLGGFDERRRSAEDYDLWLRLTLDHPVPVLQASLALVRRHPQQMSRNLAVMAAETRAVLEGFLELHPESRARVGHRSLARRLALLALEESYAHLLDGRCAGAARAALEALAHDPAVGKAYLYLAASVAPAFYNWLRRRSCEAASAAAAVRGMGGRSRT